MREKNGFARGLCCAALVLLLALSGYMGTERRKAVQTVSVPVVFETIEDAALVASDEDVHSRLRTEREKALSMLEDVIHDQRAAQETVRQALEKKKEMAERMEAEARTMQMLEQMGFSGAAVFCGNQAATVVVSSKWLDDEKARMQIIDAVATGTAYSADRIKIIPQKNE